MSSRVIIVGYMGAGKTTLGHALSKQTGMMFYDLDWYIENRMHRTVKQLFDERGEEGFRLIERNMLREVAEFENVIVSCGGGTPCFFDNMDYMNRQGETVYLKANTDVLIAHLKMGRTVRPLLLGKDDDQLRTFIEQQIREREPFYAKARHTIDVSLMDTREKIQSTVAQLRAAVGI